jgi:hypothetical protein
MIEFVGWGLPEIPVRVRGIAAVLGLFLLAFTRLLSEKSVRINSVARIRAGKDTAHDDG